MSLKIQKRDLDDLRILCREHTEYEKPPFDDPDLMER